MTRSYSTTAVKRAGVPDVKIVSPFKAPAYMSDISILVDPSFVRFGALRIEIEQVKVYEVRPGELTNVQSLKVQTAGRRLPRQAEIDVWAWSPAGNPVGLTMVMAIELDQGAASQALIAASQAELNALVADTLELEVNTAEAWAERARDVGRLPRAGKDYVFSRTFDGEVRDLIRQAGSLGFDLGLQKTLAMKIADLRTQATLDLVTRSARSDSPTGLSRDEIQAILQGDDPWRLFEPQLSRYEALGRELAALGETLPVPGTDDRSLFPFHVYTDESHTRLVNLRGARNMIISMSASDVEAPRQVTPNPPGIPPDGAITARGGRPAGTPNYRNGVAFLADDTTMPDYMVAARAIYNMLNPHDTTMRPSFAGGSRTITYTNVRGQPASSLGWISPISSPPGYSGAARHRPYYVTAAFEGRTQAFELEGPDWSGSPRALSCVQRDGRWRVGDMTGQYLGIVRSVRLSGWYQRQGYVTTVLSPNTLSGTVAYTASLDGLDIRDDVSHGGAGSVSFEIRDNRGTWREFIGQTALTQGDDTVVRYGANEGNYTLPSGPNILRARLDVTGGLQTAVSIILVE